MRRLLVPAAALAGGLMLWAASPPVGLGWLAWVALVAPAALAVRGSRWALPLTLGVYLEALAVPALPFGLAENQWAADDPALPVLVGGSPGPALALVWIPLLVLVLGLVRFPLLGTRSILVGASAWTALDLVRTKADPSGLWGPLYVTQHDTAAAALAALAGPWLVTFALVAVSLALVRLPRPQALGALALVGGLALAAALAVPGRGPAERVVAAVQPGYDTAEYERPLLRHHKRKRYAESARVLVADLAPLTRRAAARGAELVVWPEAVTWVAPRRVEALPRLARRADATLVVPFFLPASARGGALLVRPDGTLTRAEPKHRPMWYAGEGGAPDGPARPIGRVGTMLGVDAQDASVARELAAGGAEILAASTHDWEQLARQHRAFARLASVAVGRPLVRADWRNGSAIYDRGAAVAEAPAAASRTVLVAAVGAPARTPYLTVGDWFAWAAAAAAGVALLRRRASGG